MKKKFIMITAVALAGILLLTACGNGGEKETKSGTQAGSGAGGAEDKAGTLTNSPQDVSGTQVSQGSPAAGDGAGTDTSGAGQQEGSVSGGEQQGAEVSGGQQQDTQKQESGENVLDGAPSVEDGEDEDSAPAEDGWSGTYVGDQETVTLSKLDDASISFSFAQSGISGTAAVNGYQAVYEGDDHYVVVFNINDTVLDVSVSSEEDYDASGSPLIGTYVKEA